MAKLIGYLQGRRGEASRLGNDCITTRLETWHGHIAVYLKEDGSFSVRLGEKRSAGDLVLEGNVDDLTSYFHYKALCPREKGD